MTNANDWKEVRFQPHWTQADRDHHVRRLKAAGYEVKEIETPLSIKDVSEGKGSGYENFSSINFILPSILHNALRHVKSEYGI